jgi:hypothetical protein
LVIMSKSQRLRINLDPPKSGWTGVELSFADHKYSFYPSHVPYDSISDLVNALLKTLDGYDKAIVHWNDEPAKHEFVFEPRGDQIDFRVYLETKTLVEKKQEQVFMFTGTTYDVVWPFWKALRDIQSRQSMQEYEEQWREPFPVRQMVELTRRIKELKRSIGRDKTV